jgi:hypothetical protein
MKSNFKFFLLPAALGAFVWVGCKTQVPTSYLSTNGPSPSMVCDFENGLAVNPNLAEANRPGNHVVKAATIIGTGSPNVTPLIVTPGADNTGHCVWMNSPVTDPGNASYPAVEFVMPIESAPLTLEGLPITINGSPITVYDASLFSGVQFYLKVMSDDTAGTRSFSIPVLQTSNPPNGTCNPNASSNACYNNFENVYSNTGGVWQLVSFPFSSFTRQGYGSAITPPTLSGANLQQIVSLMWSEGNDNVKGTINVDFYVDQVQFF